jgi:hypothetical protein
LRIHILSATPAFQKRRAEILAIPPIRQDKGNHDEISPAHLRREI